MKREEQETTMTWDYATDTIRVYTTRESALMQSKSFIQLSNQSSILIIKGTANVIELDKVFHQ